MVERIKGPRMMVTIYALVDPLTQFCRYVGKTKGPLATRVRGHLSDAKRHPSVPRFRWINALRKAGAAPVAVELEQVPAEEWQDAEQFWIQNMRAMGSPLLNVTAGGDGIHGHKHSIETRARMSESAARTNLNPEIVAARGEGVRKALASPEARARLSERLRESHARPEIRAKLCAAAKQKANTPEFREMVARVHRGKNLSPETRAKISAKKKGKPRSHEAIQRSADGHRGLKHSPETIAKMRATWKNKREQRDRSKACASP